MHWLMFLHGSILVSLINGNSKFGTITDTIDN